MIEFKKNKKIRKDWFKKNRVKLISSNPYKGKESSRIKKVGRI
jgi:hypothetical protein